jgi:hypothetical protein
MSGSGVVTGMYLCRDKIAGSDFGQRCKRWPEGRRAGSPTQRRMSGSGEVDRPMNDNSVRSSRITYATAF